MRQRAEQSAAADCLQRPLRSRFQQQLSAGVRPFWESQGWIENRLA
jgi:hypothetical protein